MMGSENRNKAGSPRCVETPHPALASLGLFHSRPGQRKKRAFRTQHFNAATIPRLTGDGSSLNLESVCSIKLRVLAAKFEDRRWYY